MLKDKTIRQAFVVKVYCIVFTQLLLTVLFVVAAYGSESNSIWVRILLRLQGLDAV